MKIILLLSALVMSIAPVHAQRVTEEWSARERSIYFAGVIGGSATTACNVQKDGLMTNEFRETYLKILLEDALENSHWNAEPIHLTTVYEELKACP